MMKKEMKLQKQIRVYPYDDSDEYKDVWEDTDLDELDLDYYMARKDDEEFTDEEKREWEEEYGRAYENTPDTFEEFLCMLFREGLLRVA